MGMNMYAYAVKPADEEYQKKATAYRALEAAGLNIPRELEAFFDWNGPDPTGTTVRLGEGPPAKSDHECCERFHDDGRDGFQIDITKLPEGTRYVRVYCSW